MLSETLAYLFEKNEIMLETTNDDANELDLPRSNSLGPVCKVYTNSILCTDTRIINMVRRLRLDSIRDT